MVDTIDVEPGITLTRRAKKIKPREFYKLMANYRNGLDFEVIQVNNPAKSNYNDGFYFYMDIQFEHDGLKKTGITFNLSEPIGDNIFKITPYNKLYEFIKLIYDIDDEFDVDIDFNVFKNKLDGLKFKAKVISYLDNKRQKQFMMEPLALL